MEETIITFEQQLGTDNRDAVAYAYPSSTGDRTPPLNTVVASPTAIAEVYQGRWLARCPFADCSGAEYVSFENPVFFCHECRNASVAHAFVQVHVPSEKGRSQIEAYLLARSERHQRNWLKGETLADLREQNRTLQARLVKA